MAKKKIEIAGHWRNGCFYALKPYAEDYHKLEGKNVVMTCVTDVPDKVRTHQERKSIEVYCKQCADVCLDAGIDLKSLVMKLRAETEIPMSQFLFKEVVFKGMALLQFGVDSTTKLNSTEPYHVWEWCNAFTSKRLGFSIPWPEEKLKDEK